MANDIITHLEGEATQGMTLNQALEKMRGPVSSKIQLRIVRKGQDEPIELTIVRAVIRPQGAGADKSPSRMASSRSRRKPTFYILVSNVTLSPQAKRGGRAKVEAALWYGATGALACLTKGTAFDPPGRLPGGPTK
jgi:hypothetical protein